MKTKWTRLIVAALVITSVACGKDDKKPVENKDKQTTELKQEKNTIVPKAQITQCFQGDSMTEDVCTVSVELNYEMGGEERVGTYTADLAEGMMTTMKPKDKEKAVGFISAQSLGNDFEALVVAAYSSEFSTTGTVYLFVRPEDSKEQTGAMDLATTLQDTTMGEVIAMVEEIAGDKGSVVETVRMIKASDLEERRKQQKAEGDEESSEDSTEESGESQEEAQGSEEQGENSEDDQKNDDNNVAGAEVDTETDAQPEADQADAEVEEEAEPAANE